MSWFKFLNLSAKVTKSLPMSLSLSVSMSLSADPTYPTQGLSGNNHLLVITQSCSLMPHQWGPCWLLCYKENVPFQETCSRKCKTRILLGKCNLNCCDCSYERPYPPICIIPSVFCKSEWNAKEVKVQLVQFDFWHRGQCYRSAPEWLQ